MKVLRNTLELEFKRWNDPGDYPSGAGAGPLPSYRYPVADGYVTVALSREEFSAELSAQEIAEQLIQEDLLELPNGVEVLDGWEYDLDLDGSIRYQEQDNTFLVDIYPTRVSAEWCGEDEDYEFERRDR